MCYHNEQQICWRFALTQVNLFQLCRVYYNSEWLLLAIASIDDRSSTDKALALDYEVQVTKNLEVLQPPLAPKYPLVYGRE